MDTTRVSSNEFLSVILIDIMVCKTDMIYRKKRQRKISDSIQ